MSDEQYTQYAVPGAQLRYRVAQLNAAGIPFDVAGQQGGVYIIIVPAPYATGLEHLPQPHRSRKPWWVPSRKTIVTLAMVAVAGFGVYMLLSGGVRINGVELPTVKLPELPPVSNPLAGVNASLDATAASVNHAADAAKNAAITFVWIVGGLIALVGLWALRGPLGMLGKGLGDVAGALGKAVKRG